MEYINRTSAFLIAPSNSLGFRIFGLVWLLIALSLRGWIDHTFPGNHYIIFGPGLLFLLQVPRMSKQKMIELATRGRLVPVHVLSCQSLYRNRGDVPCIALFTLDPARMFDREFMQRMVTTLRDIKTTRPKPVLPDEATAARTASELRLSWLGASQQLLPKSVTEGIPVYVAYIHVPRRNLKGREVFDNDELLCAADPMGTGALLHVPWWIAQGAPEEAIETTDVLDWRVVGATLAVLAIIVAVAVMVTFPPAPRPAYLAPRTDMPIRPLVPETPGARQWTSTPPPQDNQAPSIQPSPAQYPSTPSTAQYAPAAQNPTYPQANGPSTPVDQPGVDAGAPQSMPQGQDAGQPTSTPVESGYGGNGGQSTAPYADTDQGPAAPQDGSANVAPSPNSTPSATPPSGDGQAAQ